MVDWGKKREEVGGRFSYKNFLKLCGEIYGRSNSGLKACHKPPQNPIF